MKRITVVGSLNIDLVMPVPRLPRAGETLTGGDLALFAGGKGANQACAAAKLGGAVTMLGQLGPDPFAAALRDSLAAAGVDTTAIGASDKPTGSALICVLPDGENSIVISPGANGTVTPEYVRAGLERIRPEYVLAQLETPLESVTAAFEAARAAGAVTILDPAPAQPLPAALLRATSWLTPNQSEAALLLGEPDADIRSYAEAEAAAKGLIALGPAGVVVKLGALGCYVFSSSVSEAVPGFVVTAVDTTAAGDTFNGAFAVALSEGASPVEAAAFANAAAALSVTRPGAQASVPSRAEAEDMLRTRKAAVCS